MPRGGRRAGKPGKAYGQRTDLNAKKQLPVQTAPSQGYGQRAAQEQAQQAVPMGRGGSAPSPGAPPATGIAPQQPFGRETDYPDEPVTTGLPTGAGPGPEVLGPGASQGEDPAVTRLRAVYQAFPSEALRELLEDIDEEQRRR